MPQRERRLAASREGRAPDGGSSTLRPIGGSLAQPALRRVVVCAALGAIFAAAALASSPAAGARPLKKATWLRKVTLTEYYPAPERWFGGRRVRAPGIPGTHRIDWLYSSTGVSMEGDGVGLDGRQYHIDGLGNRGWINKDGRRTAPSGGGWTRGRPIWRAGAYWKNSRGKPTIPLEDGGWTRGAGRRYVSLPGVSFAEGPSRPLTYWRSIAVDPDLIPLGSRVYIPEYKGVGGANGWFVAGDVGGAIIGRHVDVYRSPPDDPSGAAAHFGERIYVVPKGARMPRNAPGGSPPDPAPAPSPAPAPAPTPSAGRTGGASPG